MRQNKKKRAENRRDKKWQDEMRTGETNRAENRGD